MTHSLTNSRSEPWKKPGLSDHMRQVLYGAHKYFPTAVNKLVELLAPFEQLKSIVFKPVEFGSRQVPNPNYQAEQEGYMRRLESSSLPPDQAAALYFKPSNSVLESQFKRMDDLCEAMSWSTGTVHDSLPVVVESIDKNRKQFVHLDWSPEAKRSFHQFLQSMFAKEIAAREAGHRECMHHAVAVTLQINSKIFELLTQDGAYRYGLVSLDDVSQIAASINEALNRAVILTAIHPAPELVRRVMKFVEFQLSGTPLIGYEHGKVHLLAVVE